MNQHATQKVIHWFSQHGIYLYGCSVHVHLPGEDDIHHKDRSSTSAFQVQVLFQGYHLYWHCQLNIWDAIKKIITYCCCNDCVIQYILGIMMFLLLVLLLLLPPLFINKNFYHYVNFLKLTLKLLPLVEVFIYTILRLFCMLLQPLFIIISYQSSNFSSCLK